MQHRSKLELHAPEEQPATGWIPKKLWNDKVQASNASSSSSCKHSAKKSMAAARPPKPASPYAQMSPEQWAAVPAQPKRCWALKKRTPDHEQPCQRKQPKLFKADPVQQPVTQVKEELGAEDC